MQPYRGLADIYDYLLAGVDYEEWADYLEQIFGYFRIKPCGIILDLACGTGNSTFPWARRGYTVCGVDISREMIALARKKAREENLDIVFYRQDLRSLDLPFQADVAVLYQDGLNYLLTHKDLKEALIRIRSAVRPGGYFVFNLNMVEKLPVGRQPEVSWLEEKGLTLIWESSYEPVEKIWRIKLVAFAQREGGLYEKIEEEHRERSYSRGDLEPLFRQTSWRLEACYGAFTLNEPLPEERNIFYVIKRED